MLLPSLIAGNWINEQQVNNSEPLTQGSIPKRFRVTGNHNISLSLASETQNICYNIPLNKTQTHQDAFATGQLLPKLILLSNFFQGNF